MNGRIELHRGAMRRTDWPFLLAHGGGEDDGADFDCVVMIDRNLTRLLCSVDVDKISG